MTNTSSFVLFNLAKLNKHQAVLSHALQVENKSLRTPRSCPLHIPAALSFLPWQLTENFAFADVIPKKEKKNRICLINFLP